MGWLHRRRDHGGVIFLDVRDTTGIVQVVINPENVEAFKIAEDVRSEYVLKKHLDKLKEGLKILKMIN